MSLTLERLANKISQLVPALEIAAAKASQGEVPPIDLTIALQSVHSDLAELERALPPSDLPITIENLRHRLGSIRNGSVRHLFDDLLAVHHRELDEYPPLLPLYDAVHYVLKQLDENSLPSLELESLQGGSHPLALFHRSLLRPDELNDPEWDLVAEAFGESLAFSLSRGRLFIKPEDERSDPLPHLQVSVATQVNSMEDPQGTIETDVPGPAALISTSTGEHDLPRVGQMIVPNDSHPTHQASHKDQTSVTPDMDKVTAPTFTAPDLNSSVEELAKILSEQTSPRSEIVTTLLWKLLERGDRAVSHWLSSSNSENPNPYFLPPALLKAVTVSPFLRFNEGELAKVLRDACNDLSTLEESADDAANQAQRLLLVAAMLRAALLAPGTGAADLLHDVVLRNGLPALTTIVEAVVNYGKLGIPLDPSALQELHDAANWQARVEALSLQALEFRQRAPSLVISYQPAHAVLMEWLEPRSLLGPLLNAVQRNLTDQLDNVKSALSTWKNDTDIRREVERTDRRVLQRRFGKDIHSVALIQLVQRAREVMILASQWVSLHEERSPGPTYARQQAFTLRSAVIDHYDAAMSELAAYDQEDPTVVSITARLAGRTLKDVAELFGPTATLPSGEPEARHLLNACLLPLPGILLDEEWKPVGDARECLIPLLNYLALGQPKWDKVLEGHLDLRDHEAAIRLLDWLATKQTPNLSTLRANQESHLLQCRDALRRHLGQTQTLIEGAVSLGLLREHERAQMTAQVSAFDVELPQMLRFQPAHTSLEGIATFLRERREAEAETVRRRLESAGTVSDSAKDRIESALASGDVLTANEYLDMVQNGDTLPEPGLTESPFADFWPTRASQLGETLDKMPVRTLVRAIGDQQSVPGLNMSMVPGAQARRAADLLETWFAVKSSTKPTENSLQRIFNQFGFEVQSIVPQKAGRQFEITCHPLRSKDQCPVAFFGSNAGGRYRVLCVFDRPTEEDLINAVRETNQGSPCIVLHFGRLTEKRRRDLARLSRERRRTFLVVDDTLVLYLCSVRGARLPVLFACTLPFTFLEPYSSRAGLVPPEMFYGRSRERDSLVDPNGSCFIYGGRQLGKTALLRDVASTFHQPDDGQIAVYIDLKVEGIGFDRPVDEIWQLLISELKKVQVLGPNISPHADVTKVLDGIAVWLESGPQRRLLLLLDEADRFLELDGQDEYRRSERIKGLMDRSGRRFKAVFAGLHNVQRSTRRANHPLAHLGSAECIGPLLDDGQWREARALIERPLISLGYVFESSDLPTRILSQTNYYPSLIQLYIQQLLRHMQTLQVASADPRMPPVVITTRHVEEAYRSGELRKAIRDRFMWTLQLDERYELIAFALAYEIRSARAEDVLVQGLSVSAIRDEALRWWPAGFGDGAPEDSFRVLLEEMVGLGVLRMAISGGYTLRSPNVVLLMGTLEEIEAQLMRPREAPLEYAQDSFRAAFRNKGITDPSRRSPLTAQQESILRQRKNGVTVVYGTEAAGLTLLGDYLQGVFNAEFFHELSGVMDRVSFVHRLEKLTRAPDGVTLVYVPSACPWTEIWVQEAVRYVERLRSRISLVRFVFAADPFRTMDMLKLNPGGLPTPYTTLSLRPWNDHAIRQWMDENSMLPNEQHIRNRIWQCTGGWSTLLPQIVPGTRGSTHRWQQSLEKVENEHRKRSILKILAHKFGLDRRPFRPVLSLVAQFPESHSADISALLDGMTPELVTMTLVSADNLDLVRRTSTDTWVVDNPIILRILQEAVE